MATSIEFFIKQLAKNSGVLESLFQDLILFCISDAFVRLGVLKVYGRPLGEF